MPPVPLLPYQVRPRHHAGERAARPVDPMLPRVCVIGAGSSGIAAAKGLHEAGVPFDCFELGPVIGGNWVFRNPNGLSACYDTLEINTSCPRMAYSDFPMPAGLPNYPPHADIRAYFESYVDHFGFREHLTFNTSVESVQPKHDGGWTVRTAGPDGARERDYAAVLVANGHHWSPRWPEPPYPGHFDGQQIHSHDYRSAEQMRDRRVLVVGMGNSAMDVAVEASKVGRSASISVRRGQWVIRKTLLGRAIDQVALPGWAPWMLRRASLAFGNAVSPKASRYGLPRPAHRPGESHPVQSDRFVGRLKAGAITARPGIRELAGDRVVFVDGTSAPVDLIIWCTGYRVAFPFLNPQLVSAPGNDLPLWKRVVHPDLPGLYFIGLLQPLGAVMPLAEAQSAWIAEWITGRYLPPPAAEIRTGMTEEHLRQKRRFYRSPRHTMEVDFDPYLWDLARERRRGARRAAAAAAKDLSAVRR
jgi:cation diffusion facilitator CzcD-associated flavoprotein CzcO